MSNYTKTTDFEAKDSLPSGDSGKIIRGSEFETEFDNIATAIASKSDANNPTFTGTVTIDGLTVNGNTVLGNAATDTVTVTADIASNLLPSADDTYNLGAVGAEWNDLHVDGVAYIDTIAGFATTENITFGNNDKAIFGTGSDLEIYHDGSNSYIKETGTGNLYLDADSFVLRSNADSGKWINCYGDTVVLNHNDSQKLITTSTGIDVTGNATFGDNGKAIFGAGSDLQIYHDGTRSYIDENGTGDLWLRAENLFLRDIGNKNYLKGTSDAQVELFYNGVAKLETTSTGIDVSGTAAMDGLTVDGDAQINSAFPRIFMMENDTTDVNTSINSSGGDLKIFTVNDAKSSFTQRFNIDHATGDISFYEDTGTTAKFFWDASSERLGIGTTSTVRTLNLASSLPAIRLTDSTASGTPYGEIGANGGNITIAADGGNSSAGSSIIHYIDGSERMRLDSSGNVGIGTDSPATTLELAAADNDGTNAPRLRITNSSTTLADGARVGTLEFHNSDTTGSGPTTASIEAITNATDERKVELTFNPGFNGATTEAMRLDSSGNLLVGTTSTNPAGGTGVGIQLNPIGQVNTSRSGGASGVFNRTTSDGEIIQLKKDGASVGTIGTEQGDLYISSANGHGLKFVDAGADIRPCDETGSVTNGLTDLGHSDTRFKDLYLSGGVIGDTFGTSTNKLSYSTSNTARIFTGGSERVRIDSSGNLMVGTTSTSVSNDGARLLATGQARFTISDTTALYLNRNATGGVITEFRKDNTVVGNITVSASATTYNTSSDQRLKENIIDAPSASDDIDAIQVRSFDWKADGSHQKYGMVAQELQSVAPEAVTEGETEDDMMAVDYSKLVPMLVKEIQSLRARVAQLEGEN